MTSNDFKEWKLLTRESGDYLYELWSDFDSREEALEYVRDNFSQSTWESIADCGIAFLAPCYVNHKRDVELLLTKQAKHGDFGWTTSDEPDETPMWRRMAWTLWPEDGRMEDRPEAVDALNKAANLMGQKTWKPIVVWDPDSPDGAAFLNQLAAVLAEKRHTDFVNELWMLSHAD